METSFTEFSIRQNLDRADGMQFYRVLPSLPSFAGFYRVFQEGGPVEGGVGWLDGVAFRFAKGVRLSAVADWSPAGYREL